MLVGGQVMAVALFMGLCAGIALAEWIMRS